MVLKNPFKKEEKPKKAQVDPNDYPDYGDYMKAKKEAAEKKDK